MVVCKLCGRKFKNERGLSVHLARTHVHGPRGQISVKTIRGFFPLLKKRRWTEAEGFLKGILEMDVEDEWRKGYAHALEGMIVTLRVDHSSPQPYILQIKGYDRRRLQETEKELIKLIEGPLNTEFDKGYFRAWTDYINHLLHEGNRLKKPKNR